MLQNFFDPTQATEIQIPMYGKIHFITLVIMLAFVPLMIWKKEAVKQLSSNRKFMVGFIIFYLAVEIFNQILLWSFEYQPYSERFPLHLCATLSIVLPLLVLAGRYDVIRFFTFWAVGAGFISLVNPSFIYDDPNGFAFYHYLFRHYFLFLLPVFMFIGQGYSLNYRLLIRSMFALMGWAFIIFLVNWAFGSNYMHLGINNQTPIPFLPQKLRVWPWTYPGYVASGIILFHIFYLVFNYAEKRRQDVKL
jgi:hypothetical integral membrane protein (TIGR02206 family)